MMVAIVVRKKVKVDFLTALEASSDMEPTNNFHQFRQYCKWYSSLLLSLAYVAMPQRSDVE